MTISTETIRPESEKDEGNNIEPPMFCSNIQLSDAAWRRTRKNRELLRQLDPEKLRHPRVRRELTTTTAAEKKT